MINKTQQDNKMDDISKKMNLKELANYQDINKHIEIHLVNHEKRDALVTNLAIQDCGLFIVTYRIVIDDNAKGRYFLTVTKKLLEKWNVTPERLHRDALSNQTFCLYYFDEKNGDNQLDDLIRTSLKRITVDQLKMGEGDIKPIYILTNESEMDGSSVILNTEIMNEICSVWEGKVLILPYSCGSAVLIPPYDTAAELAISIKESLTSSLPEEKRLSDEILVYTKEAGFSIFDVHAIE